MKLHNWKHIKESVPNEMKYYKSYIPNTPNDIETLFLFSEILIFCISYNNDFLQFLFNAAWKKKKI